MSGTSGPGGMSARDVWRLVTEAAERSGASVADLPERLGLTVEQFERRVAGEAEWTYPQMRTLAHVVGLSLAELEAGHLITSGRGEVEGFLGGPIAQALASQESNQLLSLAVMFDQPIYRMVRMFGAYPLASGENWAVLLGFRELVRDIIRTSRPRRSDVAVPLAQCLTHLLVARYWALSAINGDEITEPGKGVQ